MTDLKAELKKVEADIRSMRDALGFLTSRRLDLHAQIAERDYGVRVGSIVKDRKGFEYQVAVVEPGFTDKPLVKGMIRKKDGRFGTAMRNLFSDWEVVTP